MIAILDNLRSIHNVASIFRTADGAGIQKIYLCGITPGPIDKWKRPIQAFSKVSLGAEKSVEWKSVESTIDLISKIKADGFEILALEQAPNSISIYDAKLNGKAALIVGPEVTGISPKVLKLADRIIEIPMRGQKESLNVSVAFGAAVYILSQ